MYRVTTPTHTFTLPIDTSTCSEILVSYKQNGMELDKHMQDGVLPEGMALSGANVVVTLSQSETKAFTKGNISVQVRVLTNAGKAFASQVFVITNKEVLNEEILA